MAGGVIELDVSAPWEPPERPGGGVPRGWRRALAGVVVAGLLAGLAGGSERRDGLAPLWTAEFQVLAVDAAGGRIIVHRYQGGGADPLTQALDARDGRMLWSRAGPGDESYAALTERTAIVQVERTDERGVFEGRVAGIDTATGAELWHRERASFAGLAGDLVVVQELAWPDEDQGFDAAYGSPDDPAVALPRVAHHERYLGLEQRTGVPRWTVELAPGTEAGFDYGDYPRLRGLRELDRDGTLRVRDLASGAVDGQYTIGFSGVVAHHRAGLPGQEVVLPAGRGGPQVFDLASGRRLWTWAGASPAWNGPVPCLRMRYCVFGDDGTEVLDPATGAVLWRVRGYSGLLGDTGDRLLLFRQQAEQSHPDDVAAFGPGGEPAWRRQGWLLASGYFAAPPADAFLVWRPVSSTDGVVGRLDPRDGSVHVIGRAPDFYGTPQCTVTRDRVACLAVGALYVWRLR